MGNSIGELVGEYLADVATRCSASTVTHYRKRLAALVKALGNSLLPMVTAQVVTEHLERESKWVTGPKAGQAKAADTIRASIVAWEQFQRWLVETKRLPVAITTGIKKPSSRARELLPTKAETKALLAKASDDFKALYLALRLTGARPGELCRAEIKDFDRTTGEIVLTNHKTARKTGKPRRIAVGHPSLKQLLEVAIGNRKEGYIFVRTNGQAWTTETLSTAYRTARKAAGLRDGLVLYLSRHEHATDLYKRLGDIKAVADALGHAGIGTTMRYTRVDGDQLKKNQAAFDDSLE